MNKILYFLILIISNNVFSQKNLFENLTIDKNTKIIGRYPQYDKNVFPKLFKVSSQEELSVVLENVTSDYFLMEFYFNSERYHTGSDQ